jgi:hypothetical protein
MVNPSEHSWLKDGLNLAFLNSFTEKAIRYSCVIVSLSYSTLSLSYSAGKYKTEYL